MLCLQIFIVRVDIFNVKICDLNTLFNLFNQSQLLSLSILNGKLHHIFQRIQFNINSNFFKKTTLEKKLDIMFHLMSHHSGYADQVESLNFEEI